MRIDTASTMGLLLLVGGLAACATTAIGGGAGGATCRAEAAAMLVGRIAPDDVTILGRKGGTIVRRIAPGDPTTKDYRVERVTVAIADGRVVSAYCG